MDTSHPVSQQRIHTMSSGGNDYKMSDRVRIELGGSLMKSFFLLYFEPCAGSPLSDIVAEITALTVTSSSALSVLF